MTDPAAVIRARLPRWKTDPYQRVAANALLRILFAGENIETALSSVETAIGFFLEDPPFSLGFASPARQAGALAKRLRVLASELEKGVRDLDDLAAYINQFDDSLSREGDSNGAIRTDAPEGRRRATTTSAAAEALDGS